MHDTVQPKSKMRQHIAFFHPQSGISVDLVWSVGSCQCCLAGCLPSQSPASIPVLVTWRHPRLPTDNTVARRRHLALISHIFGGVLSQFSMVVNSVITFSSVPLYLPIGRQRFGTSYLKRKKTQLVFCYKQRKGECCGDCNAGGFIPYLVLCRLKA